MEKLAKGRIVARYLLFSFRFRTGIAKSRENPLLASLPSGIGMITAIKDKSCRNGIVDAGVKAVE